MENCRRLLAGDLVEGMRDPDTRELEPGYSMQQKECIATGCLALVEVKNNVVITCTDQGPCLVPEEPVASAIVPAES